MNFVQMVTGQNVVLSVTDLRRSFVQGGVMIEVLKGVDLSAYPV